MPSFDVLDKVELLLRTGTFPADASKVSQRAIRAASKPFSYKDGVLWRTHRGRRLRVVRSDQEVREILTRYHDNNKHAGGHRMSSCIMSKFFWAGVSRATKNWVQACAVCQSRRPAAPPKPPVHFCFAHGCNSSTCVDPELGFYRFPKEAERRRKWVAVTQRDEASLRHLSYLCSRHFEPSCFTPGEDGRPTLLPDAVPTIVPVTAEEDEVPVPADEGVLRWNDLQDLISAAASVDATDASGPGGAHAGIPVQLLEHQYCLPPPDADPRQLLPAMEGKRRKYLIEQSFSTYNMIVRFLSHKVLPTQNWKTRLALRRMASRFGLRDGVLMYTRVSPAVRVPRCREEVNAILQQFHDNQGHPSCLSCQREITKLYYWSNMTQDVASWVSSCRVCRDQNTRKTWVRCSVDDCRNSCGPVERGLGITFHKFPPHNAAVLPQWFKAVGRTNWHPRPQSSICSAHFAADCFDRSGETVVLRPDAVPTLSVHSSSAACFAKYDAVELFLRQRTYPAGLSHGEKLVFRTFCKKFVIKDDALQMAKGARVRLVLRSRQQVEVALKDYHDELNHLNAKKCLRLLNERFFWKTMKPDVTLWINSCFECSSKKSKGPEKQTEAGGLESWLPAATSPWIRGDGEGVNDDDVGNGDIRPTSQSPTRTNHRVDVAKSQTSTQAQNGGAKRSRDEEGGSSAQRPAGAPSTKKRKRPSKRRDPSVVRGHRAVKARTVVQQCRQAKVRIRMDLDGAEAQWVEIQEGVVVYVCFYHGATEGITRKMADRLMNTKLFRKDTSEFVSVLDLPGSVLLIPQNSLLGEPGPERKVQYRHRCQGDLGGLLFSSLASHCRELMTGSVSCTEAGVKVEQGVYGQKQEMVLSSVELLTLLLEF